MSEAASGAKHLVHGMGSALEVPTWPPITPQEADAILAHFPAVGRLVGLRWHSPRPFSAATLVQTSRGEFILKRHHHRLRSTQGLAEEHGFVAHLDLCGVAVPDIMISTDGTGAVADGEWTYELHRRAPGTDLYRDRPSWTPYLSHGHAYEAGIALARLHVASRDYAAPARAPQPLVASFTILPAPDPMVAAEAYVAGRPALAAFLSERAWREKLGRLFASLGKDLAERLVDQPSMWTHNDWHPSNLLWSRIGEVRTVFDFGLATRTCALHDLATAIERTAIQWLRLGEKEGDSLGDAGAALAILTGYRAVLRLTRTDLETVIRLLPLVHIEFALSEADYFTEMLAQPDHAEMAWEGYLVRHAEWFLSAAGRDFVVQIENGTAA